jgi:predicted DNA binding protein
MKHVRVTITAHGGEADIHPMYGLMTGAPFVERATALQWNYTGDALGILHYVEGDVDAFDRATAAVEVVRDYELEPAGEGAFYAYVHDETTGDLREMFDPLSNGGVVVVPPIRYHSDGTVSMSAVGPTETVQAAFEALRAPVDVEIEAVSGLGAVPALAETRLSARQREAAAAALELGYYEIPRTASHEDVADAIGCAPSTAAEHLRKAEAKLLRAALGG